ncbi:MAG: ABC transporter substrate-binding protein [Syntrophomonadaceae bacterium]|nr:ABC transporter substrate-binding protein [Syntrophomonadaceae bacterium]MDD3023767.1 ABC transporter substrate-binding protein [Syntrophomonadaceae bacterium]
MKVSKKIISLLLTVFFVMACFTGCGQSAASGTNEEGETSAAQTERTVTDMAGRTVALPGEIKSIATFGSIGVLNAFVETMGEGSKICNEMSASFTQTDKWKYQYVFAPQLKTSPVFQDASGAILMEKVLQTKPDLCLSMNMEETALLEEQGLNVLYLSWTKTEDVKECITLLGEVLNKQDVATDYLAYFDKTVAKAEKLSKNIKEEDKKIVVYGNPITYAQPHLIAEWWISAAGGVSVTNDGRTAQTLTYTMEDLLNWNPEVMFISDKLLQKDILADARYAGISAVKNNKIYAVPTVAHVWGNRTTEQPLTVLWAMNKLYPEIMTTQDLSEEIKYFYSHFFKVELTDEQIKEIIG